MNYHWQNPFILIRIQAIRNFERAKYFPTPILQRVPIGHVWKWLTVCEQGFK